MAGGPGPFVVVDLSGLDPAAALSRTVAASVLSVSPIHESAPSALGLLVVSESTLALFLDMYLIGYLRRRVVEERAKLAPLSAEGSSGYDRSFGLLSSWLGPLLFALVFMALYAPARTSPAGSPSSLLWVSLLALLANLVYGAAFWTCLSAVWGAYRFGAKPLQLNLYFEDRMLGLAPLGQLVLLFAMVFTLAITLTLGGSLIAGDVSSIAINLVIVVVGVATQQLPVLRGLEPAPADRRRHPASKPPRAEGGCRPHRSMAVRDPVGRAVGRTPVRGVHRPAHPARLTHLAAGRCPALGAPADPRRRVTASKPRRGTDVPRRRAPRGWGAGTSVRAPAAMTFPRDPAPSGPRPGDHRGPRRGVHRTAAARVGGPAGSRPFTTRQ